MLRHATLAFVACLSLGFAPLGATDYYVSTLGDDANGNGSAASPWRSVTRAMLAVTAGDRILVAAGTYDPVHGESFPLVVKNGVAVEGPLAGTATLDGAGVFVPLLVVGSYAAPTAIRRLRFDGEANIIEVFGNPADLRVEDCVFLGGRRALNHSFAGGPASLIFDRNALLPMDEIGLNWEATGTSGSTHSVAARDNVLRGKELSQAGLRVTASGDVVAMVDLERNRVEKYGTGISLEVSAADSTARIGGVVAGNDLLKSDGTGFEVSVVASGSPPSVALFDPVLRHNAGTKNSGHGARIALRAVGSGNEAAFTSPVQANLFAQNDGSGFYVSEAALNGGACSSTPDLGGGAGASWGGNTFRLNDNGYTTGVEYDLRVESAADIPARGNWWGTSDPLLLESHIFHQVDDPTRGRVDFGAIRPGRLGFSLRPERVSGVGGDPVTAVAAPGTVFIERAGAIPMAIDAGGRMVLEYQVSADGQRLTFALPKLRSAGLNAPITLTDPDGHTGGATLGLDGDGEGGGFCFVATAAYGDPAAPEVVVLRRWRDRHLLGNPLGRAFVRTYYDLSPPLARAIEGRPWARLLARILLLPAVAAAWTWMEAPWLYVLLAAAWLWRRLRARRHRPASC